MNATEDNKIIAKFMQLQTVTFKSGIVNYYHREYSSGTWYEEHELSYNASWDWLMPVVEKIESLDIVCFEKNLQEEGGYQALFTKGNDILICHYADTSIEATYNAVVEFIKQHK